MVSAQRPITEAEILLQAMAGGQDELPEELAQLILGMGFSETQQARMLDLAGRNNAGELSPEEQEELHNYAMAGNTVSLWKAKARLTLQQNVRSA